MFDNHISISIYYKILIKEKKWRVQLLNIIYYLFNRKHQFKLLKSSFPQFSIIIVFSVILFLFFFNENFNFFDLLARAPSCALAWNTRPILHSSMPMGLAVQSTTCKPTGIPPIFYDLCMTKLFFAHALSFRSDIKIENTRQASFQSLKIKIRRKLSKF